jgi:hypothetical protein
VPETGAGAALALRRFASVPPVNAGALPPGAPMTLTIPADAAPDPWYAWTPAAAVAVCRR